MARFVAKDRKLIMHAAHQGVGVSRIAPSPPPERRLIAPLAIEVFAKPAEQALARRLIERMISFYPAANWLLQTHLDGRSPEIYSLDESDCVVILGGTEPFSPALLTQFERYSQRGGALVALHAGGQTSPEWKAFARDRLGVRFADATPASEKLSMRIAAGWHYHPVVQNVAAWRIDAACAAVLDSQAELFLEGIRGAENQPLAWGVDAGASRAFCTLLGTPLDFQQQSFFLLIWNALFWTLRMTNS
jgi:hypothetical protein